MAEALSSSPSSLFEDNKTGMFEPKPDIAMNGIAQVQQVSTRMDFNSAADQPAAQTPKQEISPDASMIAYRAETVGFGLQNQHQSSDVVALGATVGELGMEAGKEAFKIGGEFVQSLFSAFSDKKDTGPEADEPSFHHRPQPSFGAPSPSGGMA